MPQIGRRGVDSRRAIWPPKQRRGCRIGILSGKKNNHGEIDLSTTKNIKWVAKLGNKTFGSPVVSQGKVFIGTAGDSSSDAALLCFDEQTGHELGKFVCGSSHTDNYGVCSTPTVEGDRLYFVTPDPKVVCLDLTSWLKPSAAAGWCGFRPAHCVAV